MKAKTTKKTENTTKTPKVTGATATLQALSIEDVVVNKVWYTSEKLTRFSIDIVDVTPTGKDVHSFVNCVWFNPMCEVEEGDIISLTGSLFYDRYEGKNETVYTLSIKVGDVNG